MTTSPTATTGEQTLHAALELSKNSWLLAIQFPDRDAPSLYPLRGGNAEGLMAKLDAARDRVAKVTGQTPTVAKLPSQRLAPSLPHVMVHARSIVASRIGAAGFKLMRSSHETWSSSVDPLNAHELLEKEKPGCAS